MHDLMGHTPSIRFNFCLVSPESIIPKVLGIIKMFSEAVPCFRHLWIIALIVVHWSHTSQEMALNPFQDQEVFVSHVFLNLDSDMCLAFEDIFGLLHFT